MSPELSVGTCLAALTYRFERLTEDAKTWTGRNSADAELRAGQAGPRMQDDIKAMHQTLRELALIVQSEMTEHDTVQAYRTYSVLDEGSLS